MPVYRRGRGEATSPLHFIPVDVDGTAGLRGSLARVAFAYGFEQDATGGQQLVGGPFEVLPEIVGQSEIVAK